MLNEMNRYSLSPSINLLPERVMKRDMSFWAKIDIAVAAIISIISRTLDITPGNNILLCVTLRSLRLCGERELSFTAETQRTQRCAEKLIRDFSRQALQILATTRCHLPSKACPQAPAGHTKTSSKK